MKEHLIGKIVVGNYGNNKKWVVKDVEFDIDLKKTYLEKFFARKGLQIRSKKQPVIRSSLGEQSVELLP